jgi:DNA-binding transcriptional MerR regulator
MVSQVLSIGEFAQRSGVSAATVRFYESVGVLQPAHRAANGHRCFQDSDLLWMAFVLKLKLADMPLAQIKAYADLRAQGHTTLRQRQAMLRLHAQRLAARRAELAQCARMIDDKLHTYEAWIAAEQPSPPAPKSSAKSSAKSPAKPSRHPPPLKAAP